MDLRRSTRDALSHDEERFAVGRVDDRAVERDEVRFRVEAEGGGAVLVDVQEQGRVKDVDLGDLAGRPFDEVGQDGPAMTTTAEGQG